MIYYLKEHYKINGFSSFVCLFSRFPRNKKSIEDHHIFFFVIKLGNLYLYCNDVIRHLIQKK